MIATESRIDAVVAALRKALKDEQVKHPAESKRAMDAVWGGLPVEPVFFPISDGVSVVPPEMVPSLLVMPVRGEQDAKEERLRLKMLLTLYEPGDRWALSPDQPVEMADLLDRGAGWRAQMRVLDRVRTVLAGGMRVPDSDLSVEEMKWSVYTEEGLIPDLRPNYVGWIDVSCLCGAGGRARSAEVADLLN